MSGHTFQKGEHKSEKISALIAPTIQSDIIKKLQSKHPEINAFGIGSVGHKNDFDYNGDIDIAVVTDSIETLQSLIEDTFGEYEQVCYKTLFIIAMNYCYTYNGIEKWVSVDFMLSQDENFTKFRYHCPDYKNGESKYKTGTKIMLANMILNHCIDEKKKGASEHITTIFNYFPTGLYKTFWNLNNGELTEEFITRDPETIVRMAFKTAGKEVFNSVESIWSAIHTDDFKYPEEVRTIEINFFVNCHKKHWENIDIKDFNLSDDVISEINNKILQYNVLDKINAIMNA